MPAAMWRPEQSFIAKLRTGFLHWTVSSVSFAWCFAPVYAWQSVISQHAFVHGWMSTECYWRETTTSLILWKYFYKQACGRS
jgi:hypothetical protein